MSEAQREVQVRPARGDDLPFVFATWLRSVHASSLFAKRIPRPVFFERHHAAIQRLLDRGAELSVACLKEDDGVVVGYLAREGKLIHFVYVKGPFRRMGVARALLERAGLSPDECSCTHWTYQLDALAPKWPKLVYDPYRMF